MSTTLEKIFNDVWPMIFICSVILIVLRIADIIKNKRHFVLYKEIAMYFFIIYMMCLFYVVTFQDIDVPVVGYNLVPFKEMFRYNIGSRLFYKNVVGNMIMFVPFGFFVSYILRKTKLIWVIFITLIISLTIEFTQAKIGRIFDIDDVMLNILGGSIGYYLFNIIYCFKIYLHKKIDFNK